MRSFSRSLASGHETPHAHETWCVRKAANTSAGELSAVSSGTIPPIGEKGLVNFGGGSSCRVAVTLCLLLESGS